MHIFGKTLQTQTNNAKGNSHRSPWFNDDCKKAKVDFSRKRNIYSKDINDINRQQFVKSRTKYNRIKYKAKRNYKTREGNKMNEIAAKQPRKFWKENKIVL